MEQWQERGRQPCLWRLKLRVARLGMQSQPVRMARVLVCLRPGLLVQVRGLLPSGLSRERAWDQGAVVAQYREDWRQVWQRRWREPLRAQEQQVLKREPEGEGEESLPSRAIAAAWRGLESGLRKPRPARPRPFVAVG